MRIVTEFKSVLPAAQGRLAFLLCLLLSCSAQADEAGLAFFEKSIRPLLIDKCYDCHSVESGKSKGGLLLDSREGWMKGGVYGAALIPEKPEESLLIEAVRYSNSSLEMPPKSKLAEAEIEALTKWVSMGAPDPREATAPVKKKQVGLSIEEGRKFWSYISPTKPSVPTVKEQGWPRSEIDQFILARLESEGISPVADANAGALARRVYFDLTGLPPTVEQLTAFEQDGSEEARTELIDRLLESPRFGEKWGRHWLDVARYAESVTLRGLVFQNAWRYRDYVINAFNDDMPFDQFVQEQVSGDLLKGKDLEESRRQMIATGFLTLGNINLEFQDKKQLDMDVIDEQLDVLSKAFLGQTLSCARCHDHKFDPIPTRDYYAMAGILKGANMMKHANVSGWVERPLPMSDAAQKNHDAQKAELSALEKQLKAATAKQGEMKKRVTPASTGTEGIELGGVVIDNVDAIVVGAWTSSTYAKPFIGAGYIHDQATGKGEKSVTFKARLPKPGVYDVRFAYTHGSNRPKNVPVSVISDVGRKTIIVNEQIPPPVDRHFISLGQFNFSKGQDAQVIVETKGSVGNVTVDGVQFLSVGNDLSDGALAVKGAEEKELDQETAEARAALKRVDEEVKELTAQVAKTKKKIVAPEVAMTVEEKGAGDIRVHVRGSVHTLGDVAPRGFLQVAMRGDTPSFSPKESGRKELANWLTSPGNPLTARVIVNRVWLWVFGEGLVRTPDNFGTTGQLPTHPALLDWLAVRFQEEGWSIKWLVREIMLSRVYGLSTELSEKAMAVDPSNKLRWRNMRRRLGAEPIRDSLLMIGGNLDLTMGGKTFKNGVKDDYGQNISIPRRSVYLPVFRNSLPELFEVFDFGNASLVTGKRDVSTVAPQALYLMNNPFVRAQAELAAKRGSEGTVSERIEQAYRRSLGRLPSQREMTLATRHIAGAEGNPDQAWAELYHALFASMDFRYLD